MKKIIYLLLFIILISCSKHKEVEEKNNILLNTGSVIENNIDDNKIDQIKNLLNDTKNIIIEPGSKNEVQKNEISTKIKDKTPIITSINNTTKSKATESGILTEEELNIIENTTDGEIDKLIDLLFKDLN
ncbi:MAG: hypothetical protein WC850_04470 [Candidatus Gracilibacteria bacterium]